jgi:hypothetical protein
MLDWFNIIGLKYGFWTEAAASRNVSKMKNSQTQPIPTESDTANGAQQSPGESDKILTFKKSLFK